MASTDDKDLLRFLDGLEDEAISRRDATPLKDAELNLRFLRGDQHGPSGPAGPVSPYRGDGAYRFTLNILNANMKRKVALLTDSRPQIDVVPYSKHRQQSAAAQKAAMLGLWDEQSLDQSFSRECVRAGTIGCTLCLPIWDPTANYGRGDIRFLMYDPRQVAIDPSVTRAIDLQRHGEFMSVREVLALNKIRADYAERGPEVKATARWSTYTAGHKPQTRFQGLVTAMGQPWKKHEMGGTESQVPRAEVRHTWFKDFQRDDRGNPLWSRPRWIRYVVDAEGVLLKDEKLPYWHGEMPGHLFDWDIELEHPYGMSEVGGLRRLQYTLNRIMGQIVDNIVLTNRIKIVMDNDAVDAKTAAAMAENRNGIFIRKRLGRTVDYALPVNAIPPYVLNVVQLLIQAVDLATGMTDVAQGRAKGQTSGLAIEGLQIAAQSIVRLQARAFENWLERIFQHVIALIFQYFPAERMVAYTGPTNTLLSYAVERQRILTTDTGAAIDEREGWKEFKFRILPASSLAVTRVQRGVLAANLYQLGLIPGVDVLKAAEWPSPEETVAKAREEIAAGMGPQGGRNKIQKTPGTSRKSVAAV